MEILVKICLISLFGSMIIGSAAFGAYQAIKSKLDEIADTYESDNLELAKKLDRANKKIRCYQVELANAEKALKAEQQNHFEETALDYFKEQKKTHSVTAE